MNRLVLPAVAVAALATACTGSHGHKTWFSDGFFSQWDDRRVLCSMGADASHSWPLQDLYDAVDRVAAEGSVLHTYGHAPWIDLDELAPVFDYAHGKGVDFVTYDELAAGTTPRAAWAFSIDDWQVDTWASWRDQLRAHDVRFTFFVAQWDTLTPDQLAELHALASDGHDIQAHGLHHVQAIDYAAANGAAAYVDADVTPELADLAAEGFDTSVFAYPYGAHTAATDAAVLEHVTLVRTATAAQCVYP